MKKVSDIDVQHYLLKDDGIFPNNKTLPVLLYKSALELEEKEKKAATELEKTFETNDWKNSWRDGIYDYHHYHSITHEVLGVYSGSVTVQVGGEQGITLEMKKGDVLIIPAGVAHKKVEASKDFKCVGAYPGGSDYDMNEGRPGERPHADEHIGQVKIPDYDPVFGVGGPLFQYWK